MIQDKLPSKESVFILIRNGDMELVQELIDSNEVDINQCDSVGNDVMMRLLKAKEYDMVLKLMKKRNWKVNHQNDEGNTFGHLLVMDQDVRAFKVLKALCNKKNFYPNIKNKKNETILDKAIQNNYLYASVQILEDKRFDNIDMDTFIRLWNTCIKSNYYGKYSKLNNLDVLVDNLEKKELIPDIRRIIDTIRKNIELIRKEIMNNNIQVVDSYLFSY